MSKIKIYTLFILSTILVSCSNFDKQAKPLYKDLVKLYGLSLKKSQTTQLVWSTAIFDNKYALALSDDSNATYVSDFNHALLKMEADADIFNINRQIKSLRDETTNEIKEISDKKNESYDKMLSLYTNVIALSEIALKPSGSLQSYSTDVKNYETEINKLITEISVRNPDLEK